MKKENIFDTFDTCPNAFFQMLDKRICKGDIEIPRLFCSDEALDAEKEIELKYETSDQVDFGFGFFAHIGLCKYFYQIIEQNKTLIPFL